METTTAHGATLVPYAKIFENDYNLSEISLHLIWQPSTRR